MLIGSFIAVLKKAKPGQHVCYHTGELGLDRTFDFNVDKCASLAAAMHSLGTGFMYQKRDHGVMNYYLVVVRKLHTKKSGDGFADAVRIA